VVYKSGGIGGYSYGVDVKISLLKFEGAFPIMHYVTDVKIVGDVEGAIKRSLGLNI